MKRLVFILIFLSCSRLICAQDQSFNCYENWKNGEGAYRAGLFLECINKLGMSLDSCSFNKKNKESILEMLAISYLETGDQDMAESMVNLLLVNNPHYEIKEPENPELFNRLVRRYLVHPLFTLGAKNTADYLKHKVTRNYSVLNGLDYNTPFDDHGNFFTYYGMAEYEFTRNLSINGDLMMFWARFNRSISKSPGFNLYYWERDDYIELPLYLKKYFEIRKNLLAYVSGGAGVLYLYKASGNISLSYTKNDAVTGKNSDFSKEISSLDVINIRNKFTGQWNAGIGFGYRIKNLRMFLDARYLGGMASITDPEKADKIPVLKDEYFYIDNAWKLNQFEVGATISYTLFNSVKRINKK